MIATKGTKGAKDFINHFVLFVPFRGYDLDERYLK